MATSIALRGGASLVFPKSTRGFLIINNELCILLIQAFRHTEMTIRGGVQVLGTLKVELAN